MVPRRANSAPVSATSGTKQAVGRNGSAGSYALEPSMTVQPGRGLRFAGGAQVLEAVIAQTTVISALLVYFGWAQSSANLAYFGVEVNILQLSVTDFLMRSVHVAVRPLFLAAMYTLAIAAALHVVNTVIGTWLRRQLSPWHIALGCGVVGCAALLLSVLALHFGVFLPLPSPATPLFPTAAGLLLWCSIHWWRVHDSGRPTGQSRLEQAEIGVLVLLLLLGLFWAAGLYASSVGEHRAKNVAADLDQLPDVTVYSTARLSLNGYGLEVDPLEGTDNVYHYRYTGLRLLTQANGRYLVLPADWQRGRDPVFLLMEQEGIRFEFLNDP